MMQRTVVAALLLANTFALAQTAAPLPQAPSKFDAFEVATIDPVSPTAKAGRYLKMDGLHRFVAKNFTVKLLIAAAYDLNSREISGGPAWLESAHYDILAVTPGETRPTREEQMAMLRGLLTERFQLGFHRESKEFSIYLLETAKDGPKLKASTAAPDEPAALVSTVYPQKVVLPARNASMKDFTALLQRAVMDRPVVDKTGLTGKYDFDLEWAPDETQFGGELPIAPSDAPSPPLFLAMQQQLGLRLEATRGPVQAMVIDKVERPSAN